MNENLPERWRLEFGLESAQNTKLVAILVLHRQVQVIRAYGTLWRTQKWPKREAWRRTGRCIGKLLRVFGDGWEAWKLNTAPGKFRTGMKLLQSSEKADVCERLSKIERDSVRPGVRRSQFYETVSATQAMTAMSDLVTRVRNKSDFDSATVFLHRKRRVFLGGGPNTRYGRMWCFSWEELKKIFGVAMCVSLTGLGDRVVRMDGLPTGGLLSKVAVQVSFCPKKNENGTRVRGAEQALATTKRDDAGHRWRAAKDTWITCW